MDASDDLQPKGYQSRIVDDQITRYLKLFGAIEVGGTKWCGKTWTSLAHGKSVTYVDRGNNLSITTADPSYALAGEQPHVIDEWQRVPAIWDTVRHSVDDGAGLKGGWILTGSSTPRKNETSHSGAGRIGRIRMWPMTLQETGDSVAATSLSQLFEGSCVAAQCASDIVGLAELICRGGWPEERNSASEDVQVVVRSYLTSVFEVSVPQLGGSASIARRVALSLARNLGQAPTNVTLARDVYALNQEEQPSDPQLREVALHIEILKRLYLIDEVPGWVPASRSPQRMRTSPKLYFADPSIPVALLGLSSQALLDDWQTFGLAFESMCIRDLEVYTQALPNAASVPLRYYRDDSGLEIDAIVECADGSWGAFEIKLSHEKIDKAAKSLLRMRNKVCANERAYVKPPSFLAILVGVGEAPYLREDGVHVIPLRCLGA